MYDCGNDGPQTFWRTPPPFRASGPSYNGAPAALPNTCPPPQRSERERADYGKLYAEHVFSASDLFQRSGLPRKALKAIWQAANPELHQALSEEQFFLCCRLIANCQAKGEELRVLEEGGPELEGLTRIRCGARDRRCR